MSTDEESSIETTQSDTSISKGKTLEDWIVFNLLVEAENSSTPRDDFNLQQLCDEKPDIFGKKGEGPEGRRRLVQKKWERTKRRTIASYVAYLKEKKVQPSACTLKLLAAASPDKPANVPIESDNVSVTPSAKSTAPPAAANVVPDESENVSVTPSEDDISGFFSNLSISGESLTSTPSPSPPLTPPRPPLTPPRPVTMEKPVSTGTPSWSAESAGAGKVLTLVHGIGRGTKQDPVIIIVDKDFPELHRGFFIHHLPSFVHEGYSREGWKVWISTYWRDRKLWSMMTYQSTNVDLANRSVIVKGPSRPCWAGMDAEWREKLDCTATTQQCVATTKAIQQDESRHFKYWLIVFPEGTHLDNVILSGDPFKVKGKIKGIVEEIDRNEHRYHTMNWKIADRNGGVDVSILDESSDDDCD
jgi:hypothetical protein